MNNKLWSQIDIGYIAGLLEGEGCFLLRPERCPRIVIGMTDEDTITNLPIRLGIGSVSGPYDKGENRKLVWEWHVNSYTEAARLLLAIYPLMSARRKIQIFPLVENLKQRSMPLICDGCDTVMRFSDRSYRNKRYCSKKCNAKAYSLRKNLET